MQKWTQMNQRLNIRAKIIKLLGGHKSIGFCDFGLGNCILNMIPNHKNIKRQPMSGRRYFQIISEKGQVSQIYRELISDLKPEKKVWIDISLKKLYNG